MHLGASVLIKTGNWRRGVSRARVPEKSIILGLVIASFIISNRRTQIYFGG